MSVIFGIKENNRIIIAGDKRGSSIDGKTLSDDLDKVLMINDHLAFSSAGNAAIEKAISIDLNKATNKDCLTTDDLLDIIKALSVFSQKCSSVSHKFLKFSHPYNIGTIFASGKQYLIKGR